MTEDAWHDLKGFLDEKADLYENPSFLESDPIQIPHLFKKKEDIEIAGLLTATLAWGQRKTIIRNAKRWMECMNMEPHAFIVNHTQSDLKRLNKFVHRTFNDMDAVFFVQALKNIYKIHGGLETVFSQSTVIEGIRCFRDAMLSVEHLKRSEKHLANPETGSSAKRLCMYLRWMCRPSKKGVDFGIWSNPLSSLMCPLDVHSGNVARKLDLLHRTQNDWRSVEELTTKLRLLDPIDPVRYDFALFGLGAFEDW